MHCDWSGEVNQTAGATETSAGGPRERDVGVLGNKEEAETELFVSFNESLIRIHTVLENLGKSWN